MSNFAYIQPIFSPNDELFEKNKKSIISFIEYYNKMQYDFQCIFGGYCKNNEYMEEITKLIKDNINNATVIPLDRNYGKAYVVNRLSKSLDSDVEYFLTADSDIVFMIDQPNIKDRLIRAFGYSKTIHQSAGIIGLFQNEHNCHLLDLCYQLKYYYDDSEMICRPSSGGGMAGGCLCIEVNMWKQVGGYKILGVYASDDANLLNDCVKSGKFFFLSNSIQCIHPYENDSEYQTWKINTVSGIGDLDKAINEANNFWDKY